MKATIKASLKMLIEKALTEFSRESNQGEEQVEAYAKSVVSDFERYLKAYYEFKED